jgi:hypothetical protein
MGPNRRPLAAEGPAPRGLLAELALAGRYGSGQLTGRAASPERATHPLLGHSQITLAAHEGL